MKVRSNKISDVLSYCKHELYPCYTQKEADSLIFLLFNHYCGFSRTDLILHQKDNINESELVNIYSAIPELKVYRPIQYIFGVAEFCGNWFRVNDNVLIPRPETEELVNLIISENSERTELYILDIGTGSGCIAVTLAKTMLNSHMTAVDISEKAIETAAYNASFNHVKIFLEKMNIFDQGEASKLQKLFTSSDIIVSNPPYIASSERSGMNKNVVDYEPAEALFVPDENPLLFFECIVDLAVLNSTTGTLLYFEINENFKDCLAVMLDKKGVKHYEFHQDIHGKDRMLKCRI